METPSDKVGEKRPLEASTDPNEKSSEPEEKKVKLEEPVPTDTSAPVADDPSQPSAEPKTENGDINFSNMQGIEFDVPTAGSEDFTQLQLDPSVNSDIQQTLYQGPGAAQGGIPYPPNYDPNQSSFIQSPLAPMMQTPRRTRRRKGELLTDVFQDPESKWSKAATEKMLSLYADFGKRKVLDEKLHDELLVCLKYGGNPAVTLTSEDGMSFFTFLTVAAECGDMELVKKFLTEFREEFTPYDIKASLHGALANREQEIAEYLFRETEVIPDREAVMEMFDIQMSDEAERKVLPLRAFLDRCVDPGKYPPEDFFIPEVLNRAIYAHNVAALEVLFERKKEEFLPLLEQATPDAKIIRAGRGKSQDIGEGVPPLAYAAVMERPGCLEVFLRAGANPNFICSDMGGTLLHIVGHKGNTEMVELLIEYNADPRIPNERGVNALKNTKGRKARKCITDAIARLNQIDGISDTAPPLPSHNTSVTSLSHGGPAPQFGPMGMGHPHIPHGAHFGMQDPIVLSEGPSMSSFDSIMAADPDAQTPMPPELEQMAQPPPFANQRPIVDVRPNAGMHSFPVERGAPVPQPSVLQGTPTIKDNTSSANANAIAQPVQATPATAASTPVSNSTSVPDTGANPGANPDVEVPDAASAPVTDPLVPSSATAAGPPAPTASSTESGEVSTDVP